MKLIKQLTVLILSLTMVISLVKPSVVNAQDNLETILLMAVDPGTERANAQEETKTHGSVVAVALAAINKSEHKIALVNLSPETIINEGQTISSIYNHKGTDGVIESLNQWLEMKMAHYLVLNLDGLKDIVDNIEGIDVIPPITFENGGYTFTENETIHLDGEGAFAYRQSLNNESDDTYQRRQDQVLESIVNALSSESITGKLPNLLGTLDNYVDRSYNVFQLIELGNTINNSVGNVSAYYINESEVSDENYQIIYQAVHE